MRRWSNSVAILITFAAMLLAIPASAEPFKETLPRGERLAIPEAIQKALPKVDQAAAKECEAKYEPKKLEPTTDPDRAADAAACFRKAGSLGVAILLWRTVRIKAPRAKLKAEMVRDLAVAYEAAGQFDDAASSYLDYLFLYYEDNPTGPRRPKDAVELLTRTTCIYRQLGIEDGARRAFSELQRVSKTIASETLCDHVRPIAMPPQTK